MVGVTNKNLVSVIITTYHNENYLTRAIESVLSQTYPEIELIVVDDNPPDSDSRHKTEEVMQKYPQVHYVKHPCNLNGAAARNTGISLARGEYIAFLDNDDLYFSSHIADCVQALEEHPNCAAVFTGVVKICQGYCWDFIPAIRGNIVHEVLFSERSLGTGSNLFLRTACVRVIGGFDTSFIRHQDIEFALRYFESNRAFAIDQVQIIKDMGGFSNTPAFEKFLKTKRHLWECFAPLLQSLSAEDSRRYFGGQYSALLYSACKEGDRTKISFVGKQLKQYRPLDKRERILIILARLGLFPAYEALKKKIKVRRSKGLLNQICADMEEKDAQLLRSVLEEGAEKA